MLAQALVEGRIAGPATHPLDNVRGNAQLLLDRDPDKEFGLSGLQDGFDLDGVLALVERAAGAPIDREARTGSVMIEPAPILAACAAAGPRLAAARRNRERVVLATGHPTGLAHLYRALAVWLAEGGADVRMPAIGARWRDPRLDHDWIVDGDGGVVMLTDGTEPRHTHWPFAMHRVLDDERPDLVFADHGFAGAAIEAEVETISIADVNDPALIVARAQGRTGTVIVMDDNVRPEAYWPCFQAIVARLP